MVWYYGKTSNGGLVGADHLVTVEHNKLSGDAHTDGQRNLSLLACLSSLYVCMLLLQLLQHIGWFCNFEYS